MNMTDDKTDSQTDHAVEKYAAVGDSIS